MGWAHENPAKLSPVDRGRTVSGTANIDRPADVILYQENLQDGSWPCWMSVECPNSGTWFSARNNYHLGGGNFGFADGHARWSLRLLADKAVESGLCEHLSHTVVGDILKKTS